MNADDVTLSSYELADLHGMVARVGLPHVLRCLGMEQVWLGEHETSLWRDENERGGGE